MIYENDNCIAFLTTNYFMLHLKKKHFFTKAYEKFSFASAVGPLISGIYISRTLKNRPGGS